jgi:putative transposase
MQLRYRYRLDPTLAQRQALARAFGCARVVYNDGLRLREDAYRAGLPFVGGVELSRRVVTLAKRTPERAWLGEVSAVVLQQSLADLDRAYRNYFRDLQRVKAARARGEHAKLRVRKPRFKSRHHGQAVRFTLNSRFRVLSDGRLSLPKVGRLKVRWSRTLPAAPSSVTITLDRGGRYHASFVVEAVAAPLAPAETAVGIDLGLTSFAALSDGRKSRQSAVAAAAGAGAAPVPAQPEPQAQGQPEPGESPPPHRLSAREGGRRPSGLPPPALYPSDR